MPMSQLHGVCHTLSKIGFNHIGSYCVIVDKKLALVYNDCIFELCKGRGSNTAFTDS